MKVRAQFAFVFNLDKCIGCHTCSVTCKNVWTNRKGVEYAWFNNVESKPGVGYPKQWENQEIWNGGWELKDGKLELKSGSRASKLLNIFANPDMPNPQEKIRAILCDDQVPCPLSDATLLDRSIARFKTPGLRDLSHSAPFMHNGQFATLNDIINFYIDVSTLARGGSLRNGAMQLQGIALKAGDAAALVAFLKSLDEDYQ